MDRVLSSTEQFLSQLQSNYNFLEPEEIVQVPVKTQEVTSIQDSLSFVQKLQELNGITNTNISEESNKENDANSVNQVKNWKITKQNTRISTIHIEFSTRTQGSTHTIFDSLYSSLKYEIHQQISGPIAQQNHSLHYRIEVIDAETGTVISQYGKKPLLIGSTKGNLEFVETRNVLVAKSKIQFTAVSAHFNYTKWALKISYFEADEVVISEICSPVFLVFARRPIDSTSNTTCKRKKNEACSSSSAITSTPQTAVTSSILLQHYFQLLDQLIEYRQQLTQEEQWIAEQETRNKLHLQ